MATKVDAELPGLEIVASALEEYAARGIFRGFSRGPVAGGKAAFKIVWHYGCTFELIFDSTRNAIRFPYVLENVPADSSMYEEFKEFLRSRQSPELPDHRRIDRGKVEIRPYNRGGTISLRFKAKDGDVEYGVRRMVNLVNEIFLVFLPDGPYSEYLVETFDLDPEQS